jgi:hypothetical protein
MHASSFIRPVLISIGCVTALSMAVPAQSALPTAAGTFSLFRDPPAQYRSAPLWVWNDRVSEREIDEQLRDFKAHGIGGVFIHPRPGLITPYLSDEWLSRCAYAVKVGKSLGMKIWIYDENSYPSGFAGGHVPAAIPDAAGTGLHMTRADRLPNPLPAGTTLVLMRSGDGFIDITKSAAEHTGAGEYRLFDIKKADPSPWYGGFAYVDVMRRDVTDKFLEVTLDAYKRAIGGEFGKTVPGSFQDECHIAPVTGPDIVTYTPALFDAFKAKWGYDLRTSLPSLYEETGDWKQVRHNYWSVLLDLFIGNWAKPYYQYCERNGLKFTGHYWEHEWPYPNYGPDNLAMAAWSHMPGVDILMNEFSVDPHSQFGNARAVKEIRSAANQLGRERTMSETYGAAGWDLTFLDQKRIGDWEYALGVNFLNQHLSYITIMGARKRDHPQSFSYHEPWWKAYRTLGDYFGRLSVAMSLGNQENRILVVEPTTSAWMYSSTRELVFSNARLNSIGIEFQDFVNRLEKGQIEYDLGSEDILRNHGSIEGKTFRVGMCRYDLVILPDGMENIDASTLDLLSKFLAAGGKVLAWKPPASVDGKTSGEPTGLAGRYPAGWIAAGAGDGPEAISRIIPSPVRFEKPEDIHGRLFHHRRALSDGSLLFLVNSSTREASRGRFTIEGGPIEKWDPFTGAKSPYPTASEGNLMTVDFSLPPDGSLLLFIPNAKATARNSVVSAAQQTIPRKVAEIILKANDSLSIARNSPNVFTIDYCDLALGDSIKKGLYFYDAQKETFRHQGLSGNPWDNSVQYKTSILDLDRFPADSGFLATFHFTVGRGVNLSALRAVIEWPALFNATLNGKPLVPKKGEWWLDKVFGVYDLGAAVVEGENSLMVKSSPFTINSELESIYLLGDFKLESRDRGFALVPDGPLALGSWNAQGLPFYAEGVKYGHGFTVTPPTAESRKYLVRLGDWKGSFAEVAVNGKPAGIIAFNPFELDVTKLVTPGANRIEVIVYGTLKNTLGPHHGNPRLGRAWPVAFWKRPDGGQPSGSSYSTVGYGLMEDFQVVEVFVSR